MENKERIQIAYFETGEGMYQNAIFITEDENLVFEGNTLRLGKKRILQNPTFEDFSAYIHSESECNMMQSLKEIYTNLLVQVPYSSEYLGVERTKLRTLYSIPTDIRLAGIRDIVSRRVAACEKLWDKYKVKGYSTIVAEIYHGLYTLLDDCPKSCFDNMYL